MRRTYFACLFLCLTTTFLLSQSNPVPLINQSARVVSPISTTKADPNAQARILESYGKLPLSFEANDGQTDARVKFLSRTGGYSLFLTGNEAVLALNRKKTNPNKARIVRAPHMPQSVAATKAGGVLRMKLRNANPAVKVTGVDERAGTSNYFIGNDPAKWRTNVPTYAKVKYEGIYPGIDLVYYGNQSQLEYDFIVAPGADPRRIAFDVRGAKRIRRDEHGDLVLKMKRGEGEIRWHKPVVYQEKDGTRREIAGHYAIANKNHVGFEVGKYDAGRPLYIDPLIYSTYLGGSGSDQDRSDEDAGYGIAADSAGNAYISGFTNSIDFPTTPGAFQTFCNDGSGCINHPDAFVAKINPTGSALVYSTYLGGSDADYGYGIAVDSSGNAYVTGGTLSTDFPTKNPLQPTCGYEDAFVAKINPTGSALVYSTCLGGSGVDIGYSIAVDGSGHAYVTGGTRSADFPTKNPLQATYGGNGNAFVAKINAAGSALVYSTYLGGSGGVYGDSGSGIAVDSAGRAYVTGITYSADFPITPGAFQTLCNGGSGCERSGDAYVAEINFAGSALVYSTYLGGSGADGGSSIAVDSVDHAYVTGSTTSADFPTKNPLQAAKGGIWTAFMAKLNATGTALVYSTYLGGSAYDYGRGIAVDSSGAACVTGSTYSSDFPTTPNARQTICNEGSGCAKNGDAFVSKLNPAGTALLYSTYLGGSSEDDGFGIAVDSSSNVYVTGWTSSSHFPIKNPLQSVKNNIFDAFVTKIDVRAATTTTLSSSRNPSIYGQAVTFTAVVTSVVGAPPDGGTVTFKKGTTVLGTGTLSGGSASFTTSALPAGTNYIKAVYSGGSNFGGSTSKAVRQVVN
jgi:hypothetical protein